jgi:riboflavin biosynthesis pyrimidine reductase
MKALEPRSFVESLGLRPGRERRCIGVMIASADGRAVVQGRSVPLGHPTDRAMMRELRGAADVILVGIGTLRAERYATLIDAEHRERRIAAGRTPHPDVVTISRSLDVPDVPVFHEQEVRCVVYTDAAGQSPLGETRHLPTADPASVLDDLGDVVVACEGGPTLLHAMLAQGVVTDLLLTISPILTGGQALEITHGDWFSEPVGLELRDALRADDHLLLWYGIAR